MEENGVNSKESWIGMGRRLGSVYRASSRSESIWFRAGINFRAGDGFTADGWFRAGNRFRAGDRFTAGDWFTAGYGFMAGNDFPVTISRSGLAMGLRLDVILSQNTSLNYLMNTNLFQGHIFQMEHGLYKWGVI